jgi:hypothetical protein
MPLSSKVRAIRNALRVQGAAGFLGVILEKRRKRQRYAMMLAEVPKTSHIARFVAMDLSLPAIVDANAIIDAANAMLRDESRYFTFPYRLKDVDRPFNYDPFEKKYWPARHYTEQKLHAEDTPKDVKIVWEINRFKDLPTLAQAAIMTGDKRYAEEVRSRLHLWIDDNPFANSINWASGLELGVRLLSWSTTLHLLKSVGYDLTNDPKIARSIYEHAAYLRAELSTDKIVRSNHLIGEVAGLFVVSTLWSYPESEEHNRVARELLEAEIVRQTYPDGATRESTTWYHGFVTDFFDIAARVAQQPFSSKYMDRLGKMRSFQRAALQPDRCLVRIGDGDDGFAIYFAGDREGWMNIAFGPSKVDASPASWFETSKYLLHNDGKSALYVRGGEFGMGGDGSSSHAHDDLLAPVVWLSGLPVLVDPGTYVYNGEPKSRSKYRSEHSHNTFSLDDGSQAKQKLNFGWYETRGKANLEKTSVDPLTVTGSYSEWPDHRRTIKLNDAVEIVDEVTAKHQRAVSRLHFHPMWKRSGEGRFTSESGQTLTLDVEGWGKVTTESYDYSPSYRVQMPATRIILQSEPAEGRLAVRLRVQ